MKPLKSEKQLNYQSNFGNEFADESVEGNINIRKYTENDTENVISIFRSNIPKYFSQEEEPGLRNFLADVRSAEYVVIENNGEIVGAGGIALNEMKPFHFAGE